jgi:IMP dehydrogenase
MKFAHEANAAVSEIMTREVISSGPNTSLKEAYEIMKRNKIGKLPLVDKGRLVGLYSFSDVSTLIENAQPLFNRDEKHRLRVGAAVGANDYQRAEALSEKDVDVLVVDTAHGHSRNVIEMCQWIKKNLAGVEVIAGNIASGEAAAALLDAGADAVKVGIGPGSICTTRVVAGVGIPQLSAIHACALALKSAIPIIADGGIRYTGDVAKAIVAGADTVMMGSALAGTDESPGEKIIHQGRQYVIYRGMGSLASLKAGTGSRERYSQAEVREDELIPQGIEGIVPYSGSVEKVLIQYAGGLKAAMGYCGCKTIDELQNKATFTLISPAGMREGHPHDVKIIKESPNYSLNT